MGDLAELWGLRGQLHAVLCEDRHEAVLDVGDVPEGEVGLRLRECAFEVRNLLVKLGPRLRSEQSACLLIFLEEVCLPPLGEDFRCRGQERVPAPSRVDQTVGLGGDLVELALRLLAVLSLEAGQDFALADDPA
jgi:hypothetical protein